MMYNQQKSLIPYTKIKPSLTLGSLTLSFLLCILLSDPTSAQPSASKFSASVLKVDITPEDSQNLFGYGARKSTGILGRIYHRIVVMDDGTTQFILVSSDICLFSPSEYDRMAAKDLTEGVLAYLMEK